MGTIRSKNTDLIWHNWGLVFAIIFFLSFTFSHSVQTFLLSSVFKLANTLPTERFLSFYQLCWPLITDLILLLLIYLAATCLHKRPFWSTLGWSWPTRLRIVFGRTRISLRSISFLAGLYLYLASGICATLIPGPKTKLDYAFDNYPLALIGWMIAGVLTAPLIEEIVFRGVLYPALLEKTGDNLRGKAFAIAGTSALFLAIHIRVYQSPEGIPHIGHLAGIALAAVGFTIIRAHFRKLLPCYVAHLVFNLCGTFTLSLHLLQKLY